MPGGGLPRTADRMVQLNDPLQSIVLRAPTDPRPRSADWGRLRSALIHPPRRLRRPAPDDGHTGFF